jgi:hypothetical protein
MAIVPEVVIGPPIKPAPVLITDTLPPPPPPPPAVNAELDII